MMYGFLGIKGSKPEWSEMIIEPHPLELPDMRGQLHTPVGLVSVSWKRSGSRLEISGHVPVGIPFRVKFRDKIDRFFEHGGLFQISCDLGRQMSR